MPRRLKILKKKSKPKQTRITRWMPNYKTAVRGTSSRTTIRPQNNVPKTSVIALRYKQTIDLTNIPVHVGAGIEESGFGLVINMSDPTSPALIQSSFGSSTTTGSFQKSNSSTTGGQDNLSQALTDSGLYDKYDHFYVRRSVVNIAIRAKPNQYKLTKYYTTQQDANQNHYLQDHYASLSGDLYNFAVMSDRASVNLVDEPVLKVRHQLAGVKLRKSKVYPGSTGKDCSFKLVYTPKRLGIKDPGDNRGLIGFTSQQHVAENSFAQFVIGKQMFPTTGVGSALSVLDISIDYEIVACERRITNNDAVPRPLPGGIHSGDL